MTLRKQTRQIRKNLRECPHTALPERKRLGSTITRAVTRTRSQPDAARLSRISGDLYTLAKSGGLFFRGPRFTATAGHVYHSKSVGRFKDRLIRGLQDVGADFDSAETIATEVVSEFEGRTTSNVLSRPEIAALPLHDPGTPFWVADDFAASPPAIASAATYPARCGLEPANGPYLLFRMTRVSGRVPRFADSAGYVFWRPGGKTEPIGGCPVHHSGFDEAIMANVSIGDLVAPATPFDRVI